MTTTEQRQTLLPLIKQAIHDGARLRLACTQIGLSCRTVQRWSQSCALAGDRRVSTLRAKVNYATTGGIAASRSRPSVSNDNPYSEALFRTLKYRPELPLKPFKDILAARHWVTDLVHRYNLEHRHSAIRFVTPEQRHAGLDISMLKNREELYAAARQSNPNRWSGSTRNWNRIDEVHLNPTTAPNKESKTTLKAA
jgi:hypothetical protein